MSTKWKSFSLLWITVRLTVKDTDTHRITITLSFIKFLECPINQPSRFIVIRTS